MDLCPLLNVFPALVETPDGTWSTARVVATDTHVWAFVAGPDVSRQVVPGIMLVGEGTVGLDKDQARGNGPWVFMVDDGMWTVRPQGGCGCGNPLKRTSTEALLAKVQATA